MLPVKNTQIHSTKLKTSFINQQQEALIMSNGYSGPGIENQQYKKDIAVVDRKEKSYTVIDINRSPSLLTIEYDLKNKKKLKNTKT